MGRHPVRVPRHAELGFVGDRDRWRPTRRLFVVLVLVLAVVVAGSLVHPPYLIQRAGPAVDTLGTGPHGELVQVSGLREYPTSGSLDFTTVAQYGGPGYEINAWDLFAGLLDSEAEVLPIEAVYPPETTREQVHEVTTAQMNSSQLAAEAVALRASGQPERARVAQVVPDSPAAGVLRVGDVITEVGGHRITATPQVTDAVQAAPDPARVPMTVLRDGRRVELTVGTREVDGRRLVGAGLEPSFDPSIDITIDAGQVGGPSAGMMFSLAVYDKITPGPLTGGRQIAGTGTVAPDGRIGPIGGIRHKLLGAVGAGATWFLAPADDCREVLGNVPDGLHVVPVATFDEARDAVAKIGTGSGEGLPTCEAAA